MSAEQQVIDRTECWVKTVVVACNFCPFAKREVERGSIRYRVIDAVEHETCLQAVIDECMFLEANDATETTLIIFTNACDEFDDYLQLLGVAEKLVNQQGYDGIYQLASFHPDYMFADSTASDAANYTNRSPYPMFHIIREASVEKAMAHYPDPENIPERNVQYARSLGLSVMKSMLDKCRNTDK